MSDIRDAPIEIADYDASWPRKLEEERILLDSALTTWLVAPIEHIGSTSVVGMPAKPTIDIMAPVESLHESLRSIDLLIDFGYLYAPYRSDEMHWFCKPHPSTRTHHLHLVPYLSPLWNHQLRFRDLLRSDHAAADEYRVLKMNLATIHREDREAYTNGKTPLITRLLKRANTAEQGAAANPYPLRSWGCATRHRQLITSCLRSPVQGG